MSAQERTEFGTRETRSDGAAFEQFENSSDYFPDLDGAEENFCGASERDGAGSRGNDYSGDTAGQSLNRGIGSGFRLRVENYYRRQLPGCEGVAGIRSRLHPERVNATFAKLGANSRAKRPVFADHVDDWHPRD